MGSVGAELEIIPIRVLIAKPIAEIRCNLGFSGSTILCRGIDIHVTSVDLIDSEKDIRDVGIVRAFD